LKILSRTRCHPYYTQLLCQNLYLSLHGKRVKEEDIESAYNEAVMSEKSYFEEVWEELKGKKNFLGLLRFLANGEINPYGFPLDRQQIYYIVSKLEEMGHLRRVDKGHYELTDPLFGAYIQSLV